MVVWVIAVNSLALLSELEALRAICVLYSRACRDWVVGRCYAHLAKEAMRLQLNGQLGVMPGCVKALTRH